MESELKPEYNVFYENSEQSKTLLTSHSSFSENNITNNNINYNMIMNSNNIRDDSNDYPFQYNNTNNNNNNAHTFRFTSMSEEQLMEEIENNRWRFEQYNSLDNPTYTF